MTTIDLTIHKDRRANAIKRAKEKNIIIPTYAQMKDPSKICKSKRGIEEHRPLGYSSTQPVSDQLAQPTHRFRRDLWRSQFH